MKEMVIEGLTKRQKTTLNELAVFIVGYMIEVGERKPGEDMPEKFSLGLNGADKLINSRPVNGAEVNGLCDVIGGYYMALEHLGKKKEATKEELKDAEDLLFFGKHLKDICTQQGLFKLAIV